MFDLNGSFFQYIAVRVFPLFFFANRNSPPSSPFAGPVSKRDAQPEAFRLADWKREAEAEAEAEPEPYDTPFWKRLCGHWCV